MKKETTIKILKGCGWGVLAIVLLFTLILCVASPVAKYIVNTKGEEIVGRQLHADRVIINPFWGGVTIQGFECKEQNGYTNFVSFDRLYVQIAYPRLAAKHVKIRAIHLDGFNGQVLKMNDRLNLTDIIERFSKDSTAQETSADTTASSWTVALDDIQINNSAIRYRDVVSDKQWKVEEISLRIPGLYFDNTQTNAGMEFALPTGGRVGIIAGYKMLSNRYAVRLKLYDVHTDVVLPLVQDYLNVSGLGAILNGSVHIDGSLDNVTNIQMKGALSMAGLSIRDTHDDEVAALEELRVVLEQGDLKTNTFILDTLSITGVTGNYEVHDSWSTFTRLLRVQEDSVETNKVQEDSMEIKEPMPLVWLAKKVMVSGKDLTYRDYSMKNEWEYAVKTLTIEGDNIAANGRNSVKIKATMTGDAVLNADFVGGMDLAHQDTRLNLTIKGVNMQDFSAVCQNYTGYPLEGGELSIQSKMDIRNAYLKGTNHIEIDHPRVGQKERNSKAPYKNIPVKLGLGMLTSAQDMILLDVPVSGDVNNPKFSFHKVISRALIKVFFGPLMGMNDRDKSFSADELNEMNELLGEDSVLYRPQVDSLRKDSVREFPADVAMTAGGSSSLSEVSE